MAVREGGALPALPLGTDHGIHEDSCVQTHGTLTAEFSTSPIIIMQEDQPALFDPGLKGLPVLGDVGMIPIDEHEIKWV
jgi:hypothetical protein